MRPSTYAFVTALPMTPHGKVDKPAIGQLFANEKSADGEPVPLGAASVEDAVREIWEEVLEVKGIGPTDDFFDVGGTSYSLVRMFARITTRFDVSLELSVLVEGVTMASLTASIEKECVRAHNGIKVLSRRGSDDANAARRSSEIPS
jgi:syringomycin synthetase protein SyrB1